MYNLLMVSSLSQDEWELNQGRLYDVSFLRDRVFEYTDDGIEQQFIGDDGPDFDELRKLPCLFTYEGIDVVGSIGTINEIKPRNRRLEIYYTLPAIYPKLRLVGDSVFQALGIWNPELRREKPNALGGKGCGPVSGNHPNASRCRKHPCCPVPRGHEPHLGRPSPGKEACVLEPPGHSPGTCGRGTRAARETTIELLRRPPRRNAQQNVARRDTQRIKHHGRLRRFGDRRLPRRRVDRP